MGIGMERQEQIGLGCLGPRDTLAQGHIVVGVARKQDPIAVTRQQLTLQIPGDGENHTLFLRTATAQSAWIAPAMAGIEEDKLRLVHRDGRRRLSYRLGTPLGRRGQGAARAHSKHAHAGQNGEQMATTEVGHGKRQRRKG